MVIDIEKIFKNRKINEIKLKEYGFLKDEDSFSKTIPILNNQFNFLITINIDGDINYKVIDTFSMDEYILINFPTAQGVFVENIRNVCRDILIKISEKCFDMDSFNGEQTEKIFSFVKEKYGIEAEYLFEDSPNVAVFRKKENKKWFVVVMKIDWKKLNVSNEGDVEIINLKVPPEEVKKLIEREDIYPAYHMNKKHWVSVCLNRTVLDSEVFNLIVKSYECSGKR